MVKWSAFHSKEFKKKKKKTKMSERLRRFWKCVLPARMRVDFGMHSDGFKSISASFKDLLIHCLTPSVLATSMNVGSGAQPCRSYQGGRIGVGIAQWYSAGLVSEMSRVRVPAGELSSPGSASLADSYFGIRFIPQLLQ